MTCTKKSNRLKVFTFVAATKTNRAGQGTAVPPQWHQVCCLPSRRSFRATPHQLYCRSRWHVCGKLNQLFKQGNSHKKHNYWELSISILPVSLLLIHLILTQDEALGQQINTEMNLHFHQKSLWLSMCRWDSLGATRDCPPVKCSRCSYRTGRWNAHFFGMKLNFKSGPSWCFFWFIRRYVLCS